MPEVTLREMPLTAQQDRHLTTKAHPEVLLVATNWWPLSARLAAALIRNDCAVSAICPPGHPLRTIEGMARIEPWRPLSLESSLRSAIRKTAPAMVVPCDDRATVLLHRLHAAIPELQSLIEKSVGHPSAYPTVRSRERLLETARELGILVPETGRVHSQIEAAEWFARHLPAAVVKVDGSWGGRGVEIVYSSEQAASAYRTLSRHLDLATALKRRYINSDPAALWAWRQRTQPAVSMQEHVPGTPANTMFLSWQGAVLAQVSVEVLCAQGRTGAAMVVRLIEREDFGSAARLLAGRLGLSGFFGLDFILHPKTADAYLIEMNARCTQLGHLWIAGRGDLAAALCRRLSGDYDFLNAENRPDSIREGSAVAFFPQVFDWNPGSPYLRMAYHDVPWEEPKLVRLLLGKPWPERRWLYRIYHRYRPVITNQAVEFPPVLTGRSGDPTGTGGESAPLSARC